MTDNAVENCTSDRMWNNVIVGGIFDEALVYYSDLKPTRSISRINYVEGFYPFEDFLGPCHACIKTSSFSLYVSNVTICVLYLFFWHVIENLLLCV